MGNTAGEFRPCTRILYALTAPTPDAATEPPAAAQSYDAAIAFTAASAPSGCASMFC